MTDKEIITKFYGMISWADECEEIVLGNRLLLKTPCTITVPSHWQEYEKNRELAIALAPEFNLQPQVMIGGNPEIVKAEEIWWHSMKSNPCCHVDFIDVRPRLHSHRLIMRSMEGVNIQKTFENFTQGKSQAVYEWE